MSDRVTIHHCRKAGFCLTGVRRHCATVGLDFRQLVKEGLPVADLENINDAAIMRCVEIAKTEGA